MKKQYESPVLDRINISAGDVIATSGNGEPPAGEMLPEQSV